MSVLLPVENHRGRSALIAHTLGIGWMIFALEINFVAFGLTPGAILALLMGRMQLGTLLAHLHQMTVKSDMLILSAKIVLIAQ
jgi:hypothetical protein